MKFPSARDAWVVGKEEPARCQTNGVPRRLFGVEQTEYIHQLYLYTTAEDWDCVLLVGSQNYLQFSPFTHGIK